MNEEINIILDTTNEAMQEALQHLDKALGNIRAGKASPQMVSSVMVDYYGAQTPLSQVANVSAPDSRTISIQPWEKKMIQPIEKAIQIANLGFNPMNNGEMVIITVPPLTEERRRELVKQAKEQANQTLLSVGGVLAVLSTGAVIASLFQFVTFDAFDVVRHPVVADIIKAYSRKLPDENMGEV